MFGSAIDAHPRILTLGARDHALIASACGAAVAAAFERDDWTCKSCGIRLPGCMEIHHRHAHKPASSGDLETICQPCHDLHHPVWAATRGRLVLVRAPHLSQPDLTRAAWGILFARTAVEGLDLSVIDDAIKAARDAAIEVTGSDSAEAVLDALLSAKGTFGRSGIEKAAACLDDQIRVLPSFAVPQGVYRTWTGAAFEDVDPCAILGSGGVKLPPADTLRSIVSAIAE